MITLQEQNRTPQPDGSTLFVFTVRIPPAEELGTLPAAERSLHAALQSAGRAVMKKVLKRDDTEGETK